MSEEQALRMAFEWFKDVTDGRPSKEEAEAARIIRRMYRERKEGRLAKAD